METPNSQIVIYKSKTGETKIDVRFDGDTVWLTQAALAVLFQTTKQNISLHINNIFEEAELKREATVKYYLTVQKEGRREVSRDLEYCNTAFRQWATLRLREYIVSSGFAGA